MKPGRSTRPITRAAIVAASLVLAGVAAALAPTRAASEGTDARGYNVLFIISDDLGAQSLASYGNARCKTPHIDRLARRGVRFTSAYCQYPVCGPSRAALMSGLYAQAIGVTSNGASGRFTRNLGRRPSMSQLFKQNGYYVARVSKIYHMRVPGDITAGVDGPDHAASWTERFNCKAPEWMTEGEHEHLTNEKLKRDPDKHYGLGFGGAFYVVRGASDGAEQADHKAAAKAVELLEKHSGKPGKPFFLAVGLVRPHVPLVAPASFFEPYDAGSLELPERVDDDWADIPRAGISKNSRGSGLGGALDKQKKVLEAYYASVTYMDAQVGKLLAALDRLELWDETIVVFTADHGYHLGEHDFWQKMSLHEESTRIPLIIAAPGKKPAVCASLAEQIDIYPTLAELCGSSVPEHVQGRSLAKLLDDPTLRVRDAVYCLRRRDHLLRTERWAFLSYADGSAELYDMKDDPRQFTNLVNDPAHAGTLADLRTRLAAKLQSIGSR